jgi:hypothetical protein
MTKQLKIDAFLYARRTGAVGYDRLHGAGRMARVPVALKQESRLAPLEMSAQFVCQGRQDRHVAIGPRLAWMMVIMFFSDCSRW